MSLAAITAVDVQTKTGAWNAKAGMSLQIQHAIKNNVPLAHSSAHMGTACHVWTIVASVQTKMDAWSVKVDTFSKIQHAIKCHALLANS